LDFASSARPRLGLLARHLFSMGTPDRSIALVNPNFNATRSGNLNGPKPALKVSSHRAHYREE